MALGAVRRTARQNGRTAFELGTGAVVPIGRSFLGEARAAGLVP